MQQQNRLPHLHPDNPHATNVVATLAAVDYSVVNAFVRQVIALDRELGMELEEVVNDALDRTLHAAFAAGWELHEHPERLLFASVDD